VSLVRSDQVSVVRRDGIDMVDGRSHVWGVTDHHDGYHGCTNNDEHRSRWVWCNTPSAWLPTPSSVVTLDSDRGSALPSVTVRDNSATIPMVTTAPMLPTTVRRPPSAVVMLDHRGPAAQSTRHIIARTLQQLFCLSIQMATIRCTGNKQPTTSLKLQRDGVDMVDRCTDRLVTPSPVAVHCHQLQHHRLG